MSSSMGQRFATGIVLLRISSLGAWSETERVS